MPESVRTEAHVGVSRRGWAGVMGLVRSRARRGRRPGGVEGLSRGEPLINIYEGARGY